MSACRHSFCGVAMCLERSGAHAKNASRSPHDHACMRACMRVCMHHPARLLHHGAHHRLLWRRLVVVGLRFCTKPVLRIIASRSDCLLQQRRREIDRVIEQQALACHPCIACRLGAEGRCQPAAACSRWMAPARAREPRLCMTHLCEDGN